MPKLKSGRFVGVFAQNFIDNAVFDDNGELEEITFGYRPLVNSPQELLDILPVQYFEVKNGIPDPASAYDSGFKFKEVISGVAGWSREEIDEFALWVKLNEGLQVWLQENFVAIKKQELEDDS